MVACWRITWNDELGSLVIQKVSNCTRLCTNGGRRTKWKYKEYEKSYGRKLSRQKISCEVIQQNNYKLGWTDMPQGRARTNFLVISYVSNDASQLLRFLRYVSDNLKSSFNVIPFSLFVFYCFLSFHSKQYKPQKKGWTIVLCVTLVSSLMEKKRVVRFLQGRFTQTF